MKKKVILLVCAIVAVLAVLVGQQFSPERRGERVFVERGCTGCHFSGAGPTLTHVVAKHDPKMLERFILDPPAFYRERDMRPLNAGYMLMPKVKVSEQDVRLILAYLRDIHGE